MTTTDTSTPPVLHVFSDDCEYVAASNLDEAITVLCAWTGQAPSDIERDEWGQEDDDTVIKGSETSDDEADMVSKTCAEWAAGGARYLFSTER